MKNWIHPSWGLCIVLFVVHQLAEKTLDWHWKLADNHLDSLLCMPILLGGVLLERRWIYGKNYVFPYFDAVVMLIVLSVFCEEAFPRMYHGFTWDPWDYLCYGLGGLFFLLFMNQPSSLLETHID